MVYSGARGTLIYEKNLKSKFSCQTPFKQLGAHKTLAAMLQPAARPLEAAARRQTGTYPELSARGRLARQSGHTRQLGGVWGGGGCCSRGALLFSTNQYRSWAGEARQMGNVFLTCVRMYHFLPSVEGRLWIQYFHVFQG